MSHKVVIKKFPREVSGKLVKVNDQCRLPNELAHTLEAKGECVIIARGEPVPMDAKVQPDVEVITPKAKTAKAKAVKITKARAAAKAKAKDK